MNLPNVISDLLTAQANFDSTAYANCFSDAALVYDEGETHSGKEAIKQWNEKTNAKYKTQLEPMAFSTNNKTSILTVRISGAFEGSPIVLNYNFELKDGQIDALKITSN